MHSRAQEPLRTEKPFELNALEVGFWVQGFGFGV